MAKSAVIELGLVGADQLRAMDFNPNKAIEEVTAAYKEYQVTRQQEMTKRRKIEAEEKIAVADIESRRQVLMAYLTRSFDERAANFAALFEKLDAALEKGDVQALALLTNAVVELAKSSPFKDLATVEATRLALKDRDHEWEV